MKTADVIEQAVHTPPEDAETLLPDCTLEQLMIICATKRVEPKIYFAIPDLWLTVEVPWGRYIFICAADGSRMETMEVH